jgi:flagellar hook-length control protein FliK
MKHRILILAMSSMLVTLVGCSSTGNSTTKLSSGIEPSASSRTAIADQRLAVSDFKKNGVKVIYSLSGNIEAIEVTGYAPTWGGSHNAAREAFRVAELEAKKSLNDFIHKETISSKTSVVMISENLEHAQDNNSNNFSSNKSGRTEGNTGTADDLVAADDDARVKAQVSGNTEENTATRNNAMKIASKLRTTIVTTNRGILSGLYLKEGSVIDDGKAVKVVMRWDKKNNEIRLNVGRMMAM